AFTTTARENVLLTSRAEAAAYRAREEKWNERHKAAQDKLNNWLNERKKQYEISLRNGKIDALKISDAEKKELKVQPATEAGKKLAKQHAKALALSDEDYRQGMTDDGRQQWDALKNEVEAILRSRPQSPPTALALVDKSSQPVATWLLERGDFYAKKELLQVGFLSVLTGARTPEDYWS